MSLLVAFAAVAAWADWWAVWKGHTQWRPVTKPAVMVLLLLSGALSLGVSHSPGHTLDITVAVLLAGSLSLLGDVLLLPQVDVFVGGLASFLLAHVAYIAAFVLLGLRPPALAPLAAVMLGLVLSPVLVRVVRAVRATEPELLAPVLVYCAVIVAMAGCALATRRALPAVGALVFVASDAQLAWNRFVVGGAGDRRLDLGCISTYHVAQALLVLSMT